MNTNKRWSGPEFFGFTKPDVARELMKDSEHFLPEHFNKRKKFIDDKNASANQAIEVGKVSKSRKKSLEIFEKKSRKVSKSLENSKVICVTVRKFDYVFNMSYLRLS